MTKADLYAIRVYLNFLHDTMRAQNGGESVENLQNLIERINDEINHE